MKHKAIYLIAMLLMTANVFAGTLKKEFKMSAGKTLAINIKTGGSVNITGWDQELVSVDVNYSDDDMDTDMIDFRHSDSGLDIEVGFWGHRGHGDLDFTISVPRKFNVDVQTMGGGISISDVEGRLEGQTMGGRLYLKNLKGKINMTTMGGSITLLDSDLDGNLKTMGGKVWFENVVGDVNGSSMGGNVVYRNVKDRSGEWKAREKEVSITTMGGSITVDEAPMGARVKTMGGSIDVDKAKGYVDATTMGGDIRIKEIDGWVKASTMGGDVTAVMVGDPNKGERHVNISSLGGDIDVTLPAGLSIEFDVRLTYTKDSRKNYKIVSDFDMNIEESKEWDYGRGSARKHIYGTGKIKDGKHEVKIETVNGDIRIRKGK